MKANGIGILMWIDTIIYKFIDYVYDIFNALAKVNIFKTEDYQTIVNNVYIILGLIMLFVLAYSLLKAVINPDEFSKGENSFPKLVKNVVISLAIIAILPTVFTVAFNFQNSILNQNTIPALVFGKDTSDYGKATDNNAGKTMSYNILSAFLHPNFEWCESGKDGGPFSYTDGDNGDVNLSACAAEIEADGHWLLTDGEALDSVTKNFKDGIYDISAFNDFGESAAAGRLTYNAFISTIAGIFVLYVLLNFCFDMAVRVVKLMFFQIIAPIPVVCRVIPGGKLKDVFSDWMKKTISTYVEVFIRIFIIYLGVFMISLVVDNFGDANLGNLGWSQRLIAKALIIMGVVIFMRQAPKLIGDMFHLDSGSMKLGLMDKLAMGGALTAGAFVGGGIGSLGRNAVSAVKNFRSTRGQGWKKRTGSALWGAASTLAGGASGAVRGGKGGLKAKNFGDMKKASGDAVSAATAAKAKRDRYRAEHRSEHGAIDTLARVMYGHAIGDPLNNAARYFGVTGLEALQDDNKAIDDINSKKKAIRTTAEALIIGESNKQGVAKNFGLTSRANINGRNVDFNTAILRSMRQKMETARAAGAANAGDLQDEYDSYLKQFTDAVQNQALLGQESFSSVLSGLSADDARALEADLGEVRSAASSFRRSVKDNLTASYVSDIGFNASMLADNSDLNLNDASMKALGDTLKIAKQKNNDEINKIINNQQKQNGNQ